MNDTHYQYQDVVQADAFTYNGTVAIELPDTTKYNVSNPVNRTTHTQVVTIDIVKEDTLSNQD